MPSGGQYLITHMDQPCFYVPWSVCYPYFDSAAATARCTVECDARWWAGICEEVVLRDLVTISTSRWKQSIIIFFALLKNRPPARPLCSSTYFDINNKNLGLQVRYYQ